MTERQAKSKRKTLFLALLAGICGNASWVALTSHYVAFSAFPIIAFVLAVYCLLQERRLSQGGESTTGMAIGCFVVGILGYSALLKAQLPDMGSNYFTVILMLVIAFWVAHKSGITKPKMATIEK